MRQATRKPPGTSTKERKLRVPREAKSFSGSRMREIRPSGSMSGAWKRSASRHRATSRLYPSDHSSIESVRMGTSRPYLANVNGVKMFPPDSIARRSGSLHRRRSLPWLRAARYIALLLLAVHTGCIAIYTRQNVPLRVVDAETNEPIAGAKVEDRQWAYISMNQPGWAGANSDEQGRLTLRLARGLAGAKISDQWRVSAPGYVPWFTHGPLELMLEDRSPVSTSDAARQGVRFLLRLYREPKPRLDVVIPHGYRGPVRIRRIPIGNDVQSPSGQRVYECRVSPPEPFVVRAPRLLYAFDIEVTARYENGTEIPPPSGWNIGDANQEVAWREVAHDADLLFVVGDFDDWKCATKNRMKFMA